ncbi:MAG TPA: MFS transporter [Usitatibacter sp.]|jgi:MFS family permease|nr:MFS transporter [Usitatibacter sp.]
MPALVLLLAFTCNMLGRGVGDTFIVFLLPLSEAFGWTRAQVSSVYSIYLVVTGIAAPLTGLLLDRWGPRVVYPAGLALLGAGCLLAGHLTQLWQFQACIGILNGIGVSMLGMVPASMLISRWFRERMSTAMGIAYAGFGTGTLLIVPAAQYLIESHGWRETYRLIGLALLVLLPLLLLVPWRRLAAGPERAPARKSNPLDETRAWQVGSAMKTRAYWQLVQVFAFTALAMYAMLAQIVAYLVQVGLKPLEAATAFGAQGLLSVVGMMASGWSSDRFGFRATATASFVSTFVGIAFLLLLSVHPAAWLVVPFVLFFGISQGARGPIVSSITARIFRGPAFATISGTIFACMSVGGAVGSWMSGMLYDVTGGYRASFVFSMACVAIAVAPFWTARPLGARR